MTAMMTDTNESVRRQNDEKETKNVARMQVGTVDIAVGHDRKPIGNHRKKSGNERALVPVQVCYFYRLFAKYLSH